MYANQIEGSFHVTHRHLGFAIGHLLSYERQRDDTFPPQMSFLTKREWEWKARDRALYVATSKSLARTPVKVARKIFHAALLESGVLCLAARKRPKMLLSKPPSKLGQAWPDRLTKVSTLAGATVNQRWT